MLSAGGFSGWLLSSRPALSFAERDWVLVADFENRTGDARFDKALLTAFSVSLQQSRHANIYQRAQMAAALKRMGKGEAQPPEEAAIGETLAREMAQRENLRAVVACSITRTGDQFALIARLIDPQGGEAVVSYTRRADGEAPLLDALNALAGDVRRGLGESLYAIRRDSRPLPQVTTASLDALRLYAQGLELWRQGKYDESVAADEAAVKYDPDFVMAHAALGTGYGSSLFNEVAKSRQHFEKALGLTGRVTERERMAIEISYQRTLNHLDEAVRLARAYLQVYPDDLAARQSLAYSLLSNRRCEEAIPEYREVLRISPSEVNAHLDVGTCMILLGRYAEAIQSYETALRLDPTRRTADSVNHQYGVALVGAGQLTRARENYDLMLRLKEPGLVARGLRSLAFLDMYEGRYRTARADFKESLRLARAQGWLREARMWLFLSQVVRAQDARRGLPEISRAVALFPRDPQRTAMAIFCRIGVEYVRTGAVARAVKILEGCRKQVDLQSETDRADADRLEGEIELARGKVEAGIELLERADRTFQRPLTIDSLARAYSMAGRAEQAIAQYEKLIGTTEYFGWEAQQPWIEAHVALARLYAAEGQKGKARNLLDTFLNRWKNADADLPLLNEARKLRASLD